MKNIYRHLYQNIYGFVSSAISFISASKGNFTSLLTGYLKIKFKNISPDSPAYLSPHPPHPPNIYVYIHVYIIYNIYIMYMIYISFIYIQVSQRKNIFFKYFGYCLLLLIRFLNNTLSHLQIVIIQNFFYIKQYSW